MKTSLKTGFAQIFSCCPQKMGARKFGAGLQPPPPPPLAPLARTSPVRKLKRISSSSSNYVVLTFQGEKKIYPFFELVENKPHFLPLPSEVCHA